MSDYGKEEESYILKSMDAVNSAMAPFVISLAQIDFFGIALGKYLARALFPGGAFLFLCFSYICDSSTYWNSLLLELSSGFFFFAAAPRAIYLGRKYRWQVPCVGLVLALPLLYMSYHCQKLFPGLTVYTAEFLQAALIEYAIALLLMVGLEIAMVPWLDALDQKYQQALSELKQLKQDAGKPLPDAIGVRIGEGE